MDTPLVQQKVTERDVATHLGAAVRVMAAGMGFDVEIKVSEVAVREAHKETIIEGYRDLGRALAMVMMGYGIRPTELVQLSQTQQQTKPSGLVLPS